MPTRLPAVVAFAATAALLVTYALLGGAYDLVVRQELGLVVLWTLAAVALAGLAPRTRPRRPLLALVAALLLLLGWTALALAWTASAERTLAEVARVLHHLGVLVLVASLLDGRTWRPALAGATTGALVVCGLALLTRVTGFAPSGDEIAVGYDARRLSYPLDYWNAVGAWAGATAILLVAWSAHARGVLVRAAALAAAPVAVAAGYLTYSRAAAGAVAIGLALAVLLARHRWTAAAHALALLAGGALVVAVVRGAPEVAAGTGTAGAGGVIGALLVAALLGGGAALLTARAGLDARRLPRARARVLAIAGAAVVLAGAAGATVAVGDEALDQFRRTTPPAAAAADPGARLTNLNGVRHLLWDVALDSWAERPLLGSGAGTYEFTWNAAGRDREFDRDAHSLFIESLSELGLVGFLLVLAIAAAMLAVPLAARRALGDRADAGLLGGAAAVVAAYLLHAGVDWLWEATAVTVLALVVVACAAAAHAVPRAAPPRLAARAAIAVPALVGCLVLLPGLAATSLTRSSQAHVRTGDLPAALADARDAVRANPWSATARAQHGLVAETLGAVGVARRDLRRAIALEPDDWRHHLLLARIEAEAGDARAALRSYRRARALRPRSPLFGG